MNSVECSMLDCLANLFFLTDNAGKILKTNESTASLIRLAGQSQPSHIVEIDSSLQPPWPEKQKSKIIKLWGVSRIIHIFPVCMAQKKKRYLFLFDAPNILKKIDFDTFIDHIDDSLLILNHKGVIEHSNKRIQEWTGLDASIGLSMKDAVDKGIIKESLTLRVMKSGKTGKMNVKFKTGKTLTFTSIPFFGKDGKIENFVNTGRDVTELVHLQKELQKAEDLNDDYSNRLSALESLLGNNTIVHSSDEMKNVTSLAIKAAKSDSPVFILGESGVGKELIANLIHKCSDRNKKPFVGINCSAIPSELIEAEFFGYEDGAFTGARRGGKIGVFDEAKDGTIFLDEITEIPLSLQSKLLRVFQEQEFLRVGGTKAVPLRARIISSSNLNSEQLSDPKKFRHDLYYRVKVIPIFIPPLRDRREDILPLIHYFLKNINFKYNKNATINMNLMTMLYNYHWPGNIRELRNIIESLIVTTDKDEINIDDYRAIIRFEERSVPRDFNSQSKGTNDDETLPAMSLMPLKKAFQKVEQILIRKTFNKCKSIKKTAEILEIDASTIHRKIKKGLITLE